MSWYRGQGRLPDGIIMSCYVKGELTRQRVIQGEGTAYKWSCGRRDYGIYSYVKKTRVAGALRVRGSIVQGKGGNSHSKQIMAYKPHDLRKIIVVTVWRMD